MEKLNIKNNKFFSCRRLSAFLISSFFSVIFFFFLYWKVSFWSGQAFVWQSRGFLFISLVWLALVSFLFSFIITIIETSKKHCGNSRILWQAPLVFLFSLTGIFFLINFILRKLYGPDFWSVLSGLPSQCAVKIPFFSLIILFPGTLILFLYLWVRQILRIKSRVDHSSMNQINFEHRISFIWPALIITCIAIFAALSMPDRIHFYFSALSYREISNDLNTREYLENFLKYYNESKLSAPVRIMLNRILIRTFNQPRKACEILEPLINHGKGPFKDDALFERAVIRLYETGETGPAIADLKLFIKKYPQNPLKATAEYLITKIRPAGDVLIYSYEPGAGITGIQNNHRNSQFNSPYIIK